MGGTSPSPPPLGAHLTAGEEAEAGKDGQRIGEGQQPPQHTLGLQQQRRAQPKRGEIGKVIQLGTCGGSEGQVPGGYRAQGTPLGSPLGRGDALTQCRAGVELPGHGPVSQIQQEAQEQQPAGVLVLPGGETPLLSPCSPLFHPISPLFTPNIEGEDKLSHQVGHRESKTGVISAFHPVFALFSLFFHGDPHFATCFFFFLFFFPISPPSTCFGWRSA